LTHLFQKYDSSAQNITLTIPKSLIFLSYIQSVLCTSFLLQFAFKTFDATCLYNKKQLNRQACVAVSKGRNLHRRTSWKLVRN